MNVRLSRTLSFATLLFASTAFAQNPFAGNWKMNAPADHWSGETIEFAPAASGAIRVTEDRKPPVTFRKEGTSFPGNLRSTIVWKMINDHEILRTTSWLTTPPDRSTWKLSAGGKTLAFWSETTLPGNFHKGHVFFDYIRTTPGNSLMGSWKHPIKVVEDSIMQWKVTGPNSFSMGDPEEHESQNVVLDGKPHSAGSPDDPIEVTATRTGPRSFSTTYKVQGRLRSTISFKLSDDGLTLTEVATPGRDLPPRVTTYTRVTNH